MKSEWSLRDELYTAAHRWPVILLVFLLGSLVAVGFTYLLPSPYRAESGLHIAYNSDARYRNPDDYKNWQMEELELFILSADVLQKTIDKLTTQDPTWGTLVTSTLVPRLHVYWRNAGEWQLVAESAAPGHANQLARTWREVVVQQGAAAISHAVQMQKLDIQVQEIAVAQADARLRLAGLSQVQSSLQSWQDNLHRKNVGETLNPVERWRLLSLVSTAVRSDDFGRQLLEQIPPADASAVDYLPWLDLTLAYFSDERETLQQQIPALASEFDNLYTQWNAEFAGSHGLSAFLLVEALPGSDLPAQPARSTSWTILLGGILGIFIWSLVQVARISRSTKV